MKTVFAAALALSLLSGAAIAAPYDNNRSDQHRSNQDRGDSHDRGKQDNKKQDDRHQGQNSQRRDNNANQHANSNRRHEYEYNGRRFRAAQAPAWRAPRGHDEHRNWNRGDRLPSAYRDHSYVVDYRAYHLQRPAYGYQWVRVSNNVYLVNQYNGLIIQMVFGMFY
ncbi:MAG: RcnB family protein [Parvibaculum sp.]